MKKSYLILAAAATILASCVETEKINNDLKNENPTVIGFNTFSEKATRASSELDLETYHQTFAVWSTKKSKNDASLAPQVVFNGDDANDIITYKEGKMEPNNWTYSPYRYWDKQATYTFVAVAPNADIIKYNSPDDVANNEGTYVTAKAAGYTLVGQNLQSSNAPAQEEIRVGFTGGDEKDTDLMTATKITKDGATGAEGDVSLEFKHILAKLNIAIAKDEMFNNVKILIKSVKVVGLDDNGTYEESISDTQSAWHSAASGANYELSWANADGIELLPSEANNNVKFLYFIESLVMPQEIEEYTVDDQNAYVKGEKLIIDYTIVSSTGDPENPRVENFNYMLKLNDGEKMVFENFREKNNYTIFLTVRPNIITFDATTDAWIDKNYTGSIIPNN